MKVLNSPSPEVTPGAPIPSVGLLKSFGKTDANSGLSFHAFLQAESADASAKLPKLTAGAALLSRAHAADVDQADPANSPSPDEVQVGQADVTDVDGGAKVSADKGDAGKAPDKNDSDSSDLDPSDAALDAAAFAAAAQLAKNAVPDPSSADGIDQVVDPEAVQVSMRAFQSACRPGFAASLAAGAQADPQSGAVTGAQEVVVPQDTFLTQAMILPQGIILPPGTFLPKGTVLPPGTVLPVVDSVSSQVAVVPLARPIASIGKASVSTVPVGGVAPQVPYSPVDNSSGKSTAGKAPAVVVDGVVNLQKNTVVDAVIAYSRATTVLDSKAATNLAAQEDAPAPVVSPEGVSVTAAIVDVPKLDDASTDSHQDGATQNQDASTGKDQSSANPVVPLIYTKSMTVKSPVTVAPEKAAETVPAESLTGTPSSISVAKPHASAESAALPAVEGKLGVDPLQASIADVAPVQSGVQPKAPADVPSRPVVEGPHQIHNNVELWKTITDAVQRVRSENPNHLAVELKLGDGSSIGLELRMGSGGLQASFKTESQGLLKALESQWSTFVEKAAAQDIKVASSAFEGRTGPDLSGNGGNAQERREAFEDSAASAALASPITSSPAAANISVELPPDFAINPSTQSGRLNLYA